MTDIRVEIQRCLTCYRGAIPGRKVKFVRGEPMRRQLNGARAIVTGASSGIGRAIAARLVKDGARVALASRSEGKLTDFAREIDPAGHNTLVVPADLAIPADRERLIQMVTQHWQGIDLLVNNAGIGSWGHFTTSSEAILRQIMEVNFFAPVELTRLAMPILEKGRSPVVVNVTSMCGRRGMPAWPEYSASKFAFVGLSEAWRAEFARFGVDVVTIVPGLTKSDLNRNLLRSEGRADLPFEKGMTPEQVAEGVIKAIQSNRTEIVLGSEAKWMLRINRFAPRILNRLIARKITRLYRSSDSPGA